ncbi:MAG: 6,7-dimethyl-8-ribityllumazine synthase [Chthoniobacterales bacterium]
MSTDFPIRPLASAGCGASFALVVSRYNCEFTDALAQHASNEILAIEPSATLDRVDVPGAFEIPLVVRLLAEKRKYAAILAIGVIIQGETAHAELIAGAITTALLETSLIHHVPVIHEVLLVANPEQARARSHHPELNRGIEAARAAVCAARAVRSISP